MPNYVVRRNSPEATSRAPPFPPSTERFRIDARTSIRRAAPGRTSTASPVCTMWSITAHQSKSPVNQCSRSEFPVLVDLVRAAHPLVIISFPVLDSTAVRLSSATGTINSGRQKPSRSLQGSGSGCMRTLAATVANQPACAL